MTIQFQNTTHDGSSVTTTVVVSNINIFPWGITIKAIDPNGVVKTFSGSGGNIPSGSFTTTFAFSTSPIELIAEVKHNTTIVDNGSIKVSNTNTPATVGTFTLENVVSNGSTVSGKIVSGKTYSPSSTIRIELRINGVIALIHPNTSGLPVTVPFSVATTTQSTTVRAAMSINNSDSDVATVVVNATQTVVPPSAPVLSVTSQSEINKILSWTIPTGTATLQLERAINNDTFLQLIPDLTPQDITQLSIVLGSGNIYKYRIKATNTAGSSPYSNIIQIDTTTQTTPPPPTAPAAPNLSASITATGKIFVASNTVTGATAYNFEVKTPSSSTFQSLGDSTNNFENYQPQGDGTYQFRARSKNTGGYSAYSNTVSATITTVTPPPSNPNFRYNIQSNGVQYVLNTATDYGEYTTFQFPARSFAEQKLLMSLPNIPNTLTANFVIKVATAPNDLEVANALATQYGTPNVPPPPTGGTTATSKLWGIVVGTSVIAYLFGGQKKHKYNRRTLKRYA